MVFFLIKKRNIHLMKKCCKQNLVEMLHYLWCSCVTTFNYIEGQLQPGRANLMERWFFFPDEKENAFTHAVWYSAEAIPTKLKTPLFPRQAMTPEPR